MSKCSDQKTSSAGSAFERLVELMAILRSPSGCAWDRQQTLESLRPFVIEETYEVIDAIDRRDVDALREELGDFLLEAVFVAQICQEQGDFKIRDSINTVCDKLVRRHPHVFNSVARRDMTPTEVKQQWESIKATERKADGHPPGLLGGIPDGLPSLWRAFRLGRRAATVGFDWSNVDSIEAKIQEELVELRQARVDDETAAIEEEIGDLLFSVANLARYLKVDPESALRAANRKFTERFTALEATFNKSGVSLKDASAEEMETEWERIKGRTVD